jgi:hypothetical protein
MNLNRSSDIYFSRQIALLIKVWLYCDLSLTLFLSMGVVVKNATSVNSRDGLYTEC